MNLGSRTSPRLTAVRAVVALTAAGAMMVPAAAFAAGGRPPGMGGGRGGGETTVVGNNLSNPVIFASNVGILGVKDDGTTGPTAAWTGLRPSTVDGVFNTTATWNGITVWPQAVEGNSWQVTWLANPGGNLTPYATIADWGDNILGSNGTVKSFATNTAIRVEVKLSPETVPAITGKYMPMVNNGLTGSSEKWAAERNSLVDIGSAYTSPNPDYAGAYGVTVFTGGAYLQLSKVKDVQGTEQDTTFPVVNYPVSVTFVPTDTESDAGGSTGGTAPMRLAGELNASGNVVYGLNLFPAQVQGMTTGYYKLTFGIAGNFTDNAAAGASLTSNATLDGVNPADASASTESGGIVPAETVPATPVIGRAWYDTASQTTSVVFQITSSSTGQRGGGSGPGA